MDLRAGQSDSSLQPLALCLLMPHSLHTPSLPMRTTLLQLGTTVHMLLPTKCPADELYSVKTIPLVQPLNSFLFNLSSKRFLCPPRIYLRGRCSSLRSHPALKISFLTAPRGSLRKRKTGLTPQSFKGMFPQEP